MKKLLLLCIAAGTIAASSVTPAYSFKLFNKDKSVTTQTEQKKHTFFSRKKDNTEVKEKKAIKLFKRKAKASEQAIEPQISSLENYVNKTIDTLISNTTVVNNEANAIFLQSVEQLSTRRQFKKIKKQIEKISANSKLTNQEKMGQIAQIQQEYVNKYLNKNTTGLTAVINRLPSNRKVSLIRNTNQLKICHDKYMDYMQKTFEIEQTIGKLTANQSTQNAMNTAKQASRTLNDSAKAVQSLSNSLLNLVQQAGLIEY